MGDNEVLTTRNSPNTGQPGAPSRSDRLPELRQTLTRVFRALHTRPNSSAELLEMPLLQIRCLNAVAENEGQKMVDLASRVGVGLPGVSRTIDRLVQRGLVGRHTDPQDRRAVQLTLTDKARALLDSVQAARLKQLEQATRDLDDPAFEALLAGLTRLADAAEAALDTTQAAASPSAPYVVDPLFAAGARSRRKSSRLSTES